RGGEEVGRFATLVNPQRAIPPFITVLTGITDSMVAGAPTIDETLGPLLEFIGDSVLFAHNARFDVGFINAALVRAGRERLSNRVLDTVGLARRLVGADVDNCKLATLAASLGLAHQPSHRAINDVLATGDLLHHLIERAAGFGVFDLDDFAALAKIGRHPQAAKLKLTVDLPRGPGVYLFVDAQGDVLYVGKATNIRARVRSYFGTGDTRRKIGSLLKLMDDVHYVATGATGADDVASVALRDVEFCVLDLETTGGSSEFEAITEIGAVKYRGGEEVGRLATLVITLRAIPPCITVLTGITDSMVAGAPTIDETLGPLLEFIGDSVLVAHNARFDVGFINAALVRAGR
ncbi:MAG: exonuclease domain-containing protein, partial [Acidimicrobiaceae bacterium]